MKDISNIGKLSNSSDNFLNKDRPFLRNEKKKKERFDFHNILHNMIKDLLDGGKK